MSSDLYLKDKIEFNISTLEGSRLWGLDTVLNCQNAGLVFRTTTDPVFSAATFPPPHQHHPTSQKFPNSWSNQKRRQHSSVDLQVDLLRQYFALQGLRSFTGKVRSLTTFSNSHHTEGFNVHGEDQFLKSFSKSDLNKNTF